MALYNFMKINLRQVICTHYMYICTDYIYIYVYILSLFLSPYIYIYMYVRTKVSGMFLCVTKLSIKHVGYSLHVETYTCQSSFKIEKIQA